MADATFQDVLEETKRTNEILKQNAKESQQPDPLRHIKEEAITMVIERKRFKQSIALDKKRTEAADAADKQRDKAALIDSKYYRQQVEEQGATTSSQEDTEEGVRKGSIERFKQNDDVYAEQLRTSKILQDLFRFQTGMNNRQLQQQRQADAESQLEQTTTQNTFQRFKASLDSINQKLLPYAKFGKKLFELTGIGALGKKIKGGAGSVFGFLKSGVGKLIGGGLIIGMLTFFNSKLFKDMVKWFEKDGLKVIADFYDDVFLPVFKNGIKFVGDLFTGVKEFFESPRFNRTKQLFKDGKIFSAIGEGLDTIIDFAGEQFGIKNLSDEIRNAFTMTYNAIATVLNGVLATLDFLPFVDLPLRLPKLVGGKFVTGKSQSADPKKFGKMSKKSMEEAVFKRSRGMKVDLDELGFEGTAEQRRQRMALIASEVRKAQADKDIFGLSGGGQIEAEELLQKTGLITNPQAVRKIKDAFKLRAEAEDGMIELQEKRAKIQEMMSRGIKKGQVGLAQTGAGAIFSFGKEDLTNLLQQLEQNVFELNQQAKRAASVINSVTTNAPTTNVPQVIGEGSPYMGPASSTVDLLTGVGGIRL
tara:strand:- start:354 stop:2120 length:1767 start_codon:yes stop_codon:yes gene_type:complete